MKLSLYISIAFLSLHLVQAQDIQVTLQPKTPLLAQQINGFSLHCDFLFENVSDKSFNLLAIWAWLYGPDNQCHAIKHLDASALAPSIATSPQRRASPRSTLLVFNPFYALTKDKQATRLVYEFSFADSTGHIELVRCEIRPKLYETKTHLQLPLSGRLLVYDGHDFYSHHRRIDFTHPVAKRLGLTQNASRYAYDFTLVDQQGKPYASNRNNIKEWYAYGKPVKAPASGWVIAVVDSVADNYIDKKGNVIQGGQLSLENPASFNGNYLIIDHQNGEYSLLAHLAKGTISVKPGQLVKTGQILGQVGFSGSTGNAVHLHFELRNTSHAWQAEGLPSSFILQRRKLFMDTGDIQSN
ncbi:M23 family metallopeptidase [Larkinella soli]|uniref:M23 family metallopeptidase n=1 Tax=Larkinella soli TaxID=1770527 RepID=UPI000FFB49C1|nr:M23 family metallopeptidase [Larkinella soli]